MVKLFLPRMLEVNGEGQTLLGPLPLVATEPVHYAPPSEVFTGLRVLFWAVVLFGGCMYLLGVVTRTGWEWS